MGMKISGSQGAMGGKVNARKDSGLATSKTLGASRGGKSSGVVGGGGMTTKIWAGPESQYSRGVNTKKAFPLTNRPVSHRNVSRGR